MASIILRRSSAVEASRRRIVAALFSTFESLQSSGGDGVLHGVDRKALSSFRKPENRCFFDVICRSFHAKSRPLDFKASLMSQAEFAVDYDEGRSGDEGLEIAKLGIAKEIVSALADRGITKLFPIQRAVLEPAMQGRDMIGRARTGTGKTLAFGIPIMDKIIQFNAKNGRGRNPLALVLAPTRELARQVEKEFQDSAPSLDTICVYGGTPISRQMRQLDMGVDIAVGTPGRIIDLLNRGSLNLSEVKYVVIDEADQMLQVGFQEDVEKILERLPQKRHTMMFSATMPSWIKKLTQNYLSNPLTIDLVGDSDQKLPDGISLYSIVSDMYGKAAIIGPLISEHAKGGKCIVFTQTKRDADRLSYAMGRNLKCEPLHGDITQSQRERTLAGFRDGYFNVLVATDVAARGLDIPNVDLIIHYELPNNSEIFVHRSGRTGRAGKKGNAILIYSQDQTRVVRMIEREVGCRFTELPRITVDGASAEMFSDMSSGSRFGSSGSFRDRRSGDSGFGRFGRQGGSSFGHSGSYGNSGNDRSGGSRRDSFGQMGGRYGERNSGGFGSFGGSAQSGSGFGGSNRNRPGEFGGSGFSRSSGFGDSAQSGSGFGGSNQNRPGEFGGSGFSRSSGFGDFSSSNRSSGFGNSSSGRPGNFGNSSSGSGLFGNYRSGNFGNSFAGNKQDEN